MKLIAGPPRDSQASLSVSGFKVLKNQMMPHRRAAGEVPADIPMDKLKMHTPDLTGRNIDKIAELFSNCVTEAQEERAS